MSSLKINTRTTVVILITLALASSFPASVQAAGTIGRGEYLDNVDFSGRSSLAWEEDASNFSLGYFDHAAEAVARLAWTQTTPVEQTPSTTSPATTAVITGTVVDAQDPRPLNIRSGPGLEFLPFTTLALGQSVELIGRDTTGAWVQVRLADGRIGWASGRFLVSNSLLTNLPIASTDPLAAIPVVTTTVSSTGTGGLATGTVVNTNRLNVRSGPGLNFNVFATLIQSQAVTLEGRNADGSWLQVRLPAGRLGWVSSAFIAANLEIANLPVITSVTAPVVSTPSVTTTTPGIGGLATGMVINTNRLNVRSGPGPNFSLLTTLSLNQLVTLEGRNTDGSWLQVRLADGQLGWVSSVFVAPNLTITNLPVTG
jgi:uncharacterized protein YgiM (DUF1202 family)